MRMKIRVLKLEAGAVLAPLAGYTDTPMRAVCRDKGAAAVWSEMLKTAAVVRRNRKTFEMASFLEAERPVVLQIAGRDPDEAAESARMLQELKPDAVDFNAGCPVKKILREGAGAALMKEPALVREILCAMKKVLSIPLFVKIRLGWDDDIMTGVEIVRMAEGEGADAVAVHGRTARQMFHGRCSLDGIRKIVSAVSIPVIGNGDVRTGADAARMMEETGCAAVMVGRAAIGNPWIFREINSVLDGRSDFQRPGFSELGGTMRKHYDLIERRYGEFAGIRIWRKHAAAYIKGKPDCRHFRRMLMQMKSRIDFEGVMAEMFAFWEK